MRTINLHQGVWIAKWSEKNEQIFNILLLVVKIYVMQLVFKHLSKS